MSQSKSIEVYTPSGILLCKAILTEVETVPPPTSESLTNHSTKSEKGNGKSNGDSITDPQKRLLFRLMATNYQLEGDAAFDKIKKLFGVNSFKEVSKLDASKVIERLLEEERGGNHD